MFENMEDSTIIILAVAAVAIVLWAYYAIIKAATQSDSVIKHLDRQNRLLSKLLEKNGVSKEEIEETISGESKTQ